MATLPSDSTYGTITGSFVKQVVDGSDSGSEPDAAVISGTIKIIPQVDQVYIDGVYIATGPISIDLDNTGSFTVQLLATDNDNMTPKNWFYTIQSNLVGASNPPDASFYLPANSTVNLTQILSVPTLTTLPDGGFVRSINGESGDVTGFLMSSQVGQPNGVASLDADGKVPSSQLTIMGLITTTTVADQAARLALPENDNAQIAIQLDTGVEYVLPGGADPTVDANWSVLNDNPGGELTANKNQPNGYAGLDSSGKLLTTVIPDLPYDASGAATTAGNNAKTYADTKVATEQSRAEAVESLKADLVDGIVPLSQLPTNIGNSGLKNGSGAPTSDIGNDGDFYIDTAADVLYGPKTSGAWGTGVSLIGAQGPQGEPGADGHDAYPIVVAQEGVINPSSLSDGTLLLEYTE